ncbi:acyltransferase family protein [Kytococcus sedentarius]|uniref:acyltransferase family protein n=1 Tax=Kytococcus sedentarius TaxID=1276 RepID=UPI0035BC865E
MRDAPSPAAHHPGFRPDVEGLRAIAVLSVLAYHAGLPVVTGGFAGVDVFFVLSGFLISGQLLKEVERSGTVDLPAFYGRRFKRLLPAASMVLVFTAIGAWLLLPSTRLREVFGDIAASALWLINWRLADRSTDYLAEDSLPSPVQHYWSMAVEEQFYVIWPVVLLGVAWVAARNTHPVRRIAAVGLLLIGLPSLLWSVAHTTASPEAAYFLTTTRLWELVLGGLVACGAALWPRIRLPWATSLLMLGVAMVVASFVVFDASTPWPGSAALLPTVGTACALVGGYRARGPVMAWLSSRPMVWVGGLSYSLYLCHWPSVVFAEQGVFDGEAPAWVPVVAVALSFPLAWAGQRLIENPVRFAPSMRRTGTALAAGGLQVITVAAACALVVTSLPAPTPVNLAEEGYWGAEQLLPDPGDATVATVRPVVREGTFPANPARVVPAPEAATADSPAGHALGCHVAEESAEPVECRFGDLEGTTTVVLAGDSKALQWQPAIDAWARERGYLVISHTKSSCTWAAVLLPHRGGYPNCLEWGQKVRDRLQEIDPDVLLVSGASRAGLTAADDPEAEVATLAQGYRQYWTELTDRGTRIVALLDTPTPPQLVYECVAEHRQDVSACDFPAEEAKGSPPLRQAVEQVPGARLVDLNDFLCPEGTCRAVMGEVLTYRQGAHVTVTWVKTLQPVFDARLDAALEGHPRLAG